MPIPFIVEDTFRLNQESKADFFDDYVVIDNFYEDIEGIQDLFKNMSVENWKGSKWSRNFKDYYDCRPIFANNYPEYHKMEARLRPLSQLVANMVGKDSIEIEKSLQFNVFKHIKKDVPQHKQHHPHYDTDKVNILIYIDEHANGGTALYENKDMQNREDVNLIVDIREFDLLEVIEAKPNRCVIFNGNQLHGAWINDNKVYEDNWRITQASIVKL